MTIVSSGEGGGDGFKPKLGTSKGGCYSVEEEFTSREEASKIIGSKKVRSCKREAKS